MKDIEYTNEGDSGGQTLRTVLTVDRAILVCVIAILAIRVIRQIDLGMSSLALVTDVVVLALVYYAGCLAGKRRRRPSNDS